MRRFISDLISLVLVGAAVLGFYVYRDNLSNLVEDILIDKEEIIVLEKNEYTRYYDYNKFQMEEDFQPNNYGDLLNIMYTVLNSGWEEFFFYCPPSYGNCMVDLVGTKDDKGIITDEQLLSRINNYVSPYNSYITISATTNNYGKITLLINYNYSEEEISILNEKVDSIIEENIYSNMTTTQKIRVVHNYIINNATYDNDFVETGNNQYRSNTAIGPLINNYAVCSGYSDAMAIFLDKLEIANFKISNDNHIWNYVLVDGEWLHLDLTWNDPIAADGEDRLIYSYFLISDEKLEELNDGSHYYDKEFYQVDL